MVSNIKKIHKSFCTPLVLKNCDTSRSQLMLKAYLILVHAEFESYIESIITEKTDIALNNYVKLKELDKTIGGIVAYSNMVYEAPNKFVDANDPKARKTFDTIVNKECKMFKQEIKYLNNGIKIKNIAPLISKIGLDINSFDETEMNELEIFGENRGFIAHNSIGINRVIDYSTEENHIQNIILLFSKIDNMIMN